MKLFRQSIGRAPHNYVLQQRIERAKQQLWDPKRSVIEAGLDAGFQNPSHFARMFRKLVDSTPSRFDYICCQVDEITVWSAKLSGLSSSSYKS
jgi:AraC-like DNA-binding protein